MPRASKLPAVALTVDVALIVALIWGFLGINPLGRDLVALGPSVALARLPTRSGANATSADWLAYLAGHELGFYATSTPQTADFAREGAWINSLILPGSVCAALPPVVATWLRNLVAAYALYFGVGALWCVAIYWVGGARWFPNPTDRPSWKDVTDQSACRADARGRAGVEHPPPRLPAPAAAAVSVASVAMPFYTLMPTAGEWLMERGLTVAYYDVASVGGWGAAIAGFCAYLLLVVSAAGCGGGGGWGGAFSLTTPPLRILL